MTGTQESAACARFPHSIAQHTRTTPPPPHKHLSSGLLPTPLVLPALQLPPIANGAAATALSTNGGPPPGELPLQPDGGTQAAGDSFATGATLPEGLLADLEALRAAQRAGGGAGGADGKPGLSTQALLDILDSDPRFRAERSMISALLNQPKKVGRGGGGAGAGPYMGPGWCLCPGRSTPVYQTITSASTPVR